MIGQFKAEVGRDIRRFEALGGGEADDYMASLANELNGAGRNRDLGWGIWVLGMGMLVGLGI